MTQRIGTIITAPVVIGDTDIPQPSHFPNTGQGGIHAYDFLNNGTELSVYGIKKHHRDWNMLASAADKKATYKLVKGHFNTDIMDNRNWKLWKDDDSNGGSSFDLWLDANKPYANNKFVSHNNAIWRSTKDNNTTEPGTIINEETGELSPDWVESSVDSLAHERNKDTAGVRDNGVSYSFEQIYQDILARIAKSDITTDQTLGGVNASDQAIVSQKAIKAYVDALLSNALRTPSAFNASTATTFPVGKKGDSFKVTLPGTVQGVKLQAGDFIFTDLANATANAADWNVIQSNVDQATTEVLGLIKIATNQETINELLTDKAIVPAGLAAWWNHVKGRTNIVFSELVSFLGLDLGTAATAGTTRTITAKGSETNVDIALNTKGSGKLKSNSLAHNGTDLIIAATINGELYSTSLDPAKVVQQVQLANMYYISITGGNDGTGVKGRIDRPYQSLAQVQTVLTDNDAVVFLPGTYAISTATITQANIVFYLQNATLTGNLALQGSGSTVLSDGTGSVTGIIGFSGVDNSKVCYIKNLKRCGLSRGTIYVNGVDEITASTDACQYYINNVGKWSTILRSIIELINVREIVPQASFTWAKGAVVKGCRFYTNVAATSNITFTTNNLTLDDCVLRDCEFVSTQSYNFQATGEDIVSTGLKFINCKFVAGAAYHLDMTVNGAFPNTKLNLVFIGCDIQRVPFVKTGNLTTTTSYILSPQLLENTIDILYKGSPLGFAFNAGTVLFVAPEGSDMQGLRGRMDRPYRTMQAAINAALTGDSIVVYPHIQYVYQGATVTIPDNKSLSIFIKGVKTNGIQNVGNNSKSYIYGDALTDIEAVYGVGEMEVHNVGLLNYVFQFGSGFWKIVKTNVKNNAGCTDLRGNRVEFINCIIRSLTATAINAGNPTVVLDNCEVYGNTDAINASLFRIHNSYIESTTGRAIYSGYAFNGLVEKSRIKAFTSALTVHGGTFTSGIKLAFYDTRIVMDNSATKSIELLAPFLPASPNTLLTKNVLVNKPIALNGNLHEGSDTYETTNIIL